MRDNDKQLLRLEKMFRISPVEMRQIIKDFHLEMRKGLLGRKSSLKMLPAHTGRPSGEEKGEFIALDLGGTNLRVLALKLKGNRRFGASASEKFVLDKRHVTGKPEKLFDFIAGCLKGFLKRKKIDCGRIIDLGFTFSFPVDQDGVASGRLLGWTKGFHIKGAIGKDVVGLLNDALERKGLYNIKVAALANDTVTTLAAKSYCDKTCDAGLILGTGTNACYAERLANIRKWHGSSARSGEMIVNIEWGNFNKLKAASYDRLLDKRSNNPGEQTLEKMVSGMYLGEISRLALKDLGGSLGKIQEFKTEYMSAVEADSSGGLRRVGALLRKVGVSNSTLQDRRVCKRVCALTSLRAARIAASCIAAVVTKMDPALSRSHTVAVDGSLYEKHPAFAGNIRKALSEILKRKSSRISMSLTKDGSGFGAAVIAAVAVT